MFKIVERIALVGGILLLSADPSVFPAMTNFVPCIYNEVLL